MGILFFIIAALMLMADAFDLLKGNINWVELTAGFVVLGVAFNGVALPKLPVVVRNE